MFDLMQYFDESYVPPAMSVWEELVLQAIANGVHRGYDIHRYVGGNSYWVGECLRDLVENKTIWVREVNGNPSIREYFFDGDDGTSGQPAIVQL